MRFWLFTLLAGIMRVATADSLVHETMLDNGLKVIVKEDHRAPVVVSQIWYKVGSSYEHGGSTGLSHVLEHLMFKGTKLHTMGEFSRIIAANGGQENAFTSRDYTAYYQQLEKSRLPISFELEADRMRNLTIDPAEFAKELQVVMEERRLRTEDDPQAMTTEQFSAVAYLNSPYKHPIIGWQTDLDAMTLDDAMAWYRRWYAPNNATVVVVGDVMPQDVFALAKKHYGPIPKQPITAPKPQQEVAQVGERRIVVKAPAEMPYVVMGYKVPSLATAKEAWEPYALMVLAGVLEGGQSSRFANTLVRGREIAVSASVGYSPQDRLTTLFELDGTPAQGHKVEQLEQALREQVQQVRDHLISADELKRVKAQVVASDVFQRDSMFYQAMQIGILETTGLGWRVGEKSVDNIRAVTAEQIQMVAKRYLIDDNLSVAVLEPLPLDGKRIRQGSSLGGGHVR